MSFRLRLIVCITVLIALAFGIGGTVLVSTSFYTSLNKEIEAALKAYETVQNTLYLLNSLGDQTDYDSLADVLSKMAEQNTASWSALSLTTEDAVIYQSGNEAFLSYSIPSPEAGQWGYTQVADEYGNGLLVLSTILAGSSQLSLQARFDLTSVYEARRTQQRLFFTIYLVVVILGLLTSIIFSFGLTSRLNRLTRTVRQISSGNLSIRSKLKSHDEFGQLSQDFDAMADKLQENIGHMEAQMQQQEAFMGAFAHELKTPMTSIIGYADLLRQGDLDDNTRLTAANYIFSEGKRLETLSFKLLELLLLKNDKLSMREVNLHSFLLEIDKALAPVLRKKGIRLICKGDQGKAMFEPDLVKSLLYNLIDNASKAMDGDGIIGVTGSPIAGGCQFQVVDNGRGMESSELTRITEAFYRVDKSRSRKQGGAGLGLALCQQIVSLHHGTMNFISAVGTGTRVTVTLYGTEGEVCES